MLDLFGNPVDEPDPPKVPIKPQPPRSLADSTLPRWELKDPPNLFDAKDLIVNFETNGLHWWKDHRPIGMTVGTLDGTLSVYLPFGHHGGGPQHDEAAILRYAQDLLKNKHITNANTKFEVHMARSWGVDLEAQGCTVSDVQHYAALLDDNRRRFGLDVLADDYLGGTTIPRVDETRMAEYASYEVAPRAEYQAVLVAQLREKMWPELDRQELQRVRQLEDEVIYPVCHMEANAAPIDKELLDLWCEETEKLQTELIEDIAKHVGFPMNPDANADWIKLFDTLGIPIEHFTAKGAASFTDVILSQIDNPYVQKARQAGKIASHRSKFLEAYRDVVGDDWLLRYQLHQLRNDEKGTVRGRFSASDKNIQQVMNHDTHMKVFGSEDYYVRRLFIPALMYLLSADAAQIEFRLFASYSESKKILAAYKEDPTISYHKLVWGMIKPFKPDIDYTKVKSYNFLKIYGGGRDKAAAHLELPRSESDKIVDIYDRTIPEAKTLIKKAERMAKSRGFVKTVMGRRARFPNPDFAYKALNAVIQGSAADIMKQKLVELHKVRADTGFIMRYTVHDEVVGDVEYQADADKVREVLNRQSFPELAVPILWSVQTGKHWGECK